MIELIEAKWKAVQLFYERHYRDQKKRPIRFHQRPADSEIHMLYDQMVKASKYFQGFYLQHEALFHRLQKRRGVAPQDLSDQKIKS